MRLSVIVIFFICRFSNAQPAISISYLPDMPEPISNNAVAGVSYGDNFLIYSFGGIDSTLAYKGITRKSFCFDSKTKSWNRITDLPDSLGKIASSASRIGDFIYIIGGYYVFEDGHEISSNKVHRFHIPSNKFITDGQPIPVPIDDHVQTIWKDSLIYVITGWSNNRNKSYVQIYNPYSDQWLAGTPLPEDENYMSFGASGAIYKNTIIFIGGAQFEKNYPAQNKMRVGIIDQDNPFSITWKIINPSQDLFAYRAAPFLFENYMIWAGGSLVTYNYNGISYSSKLPVSPSGRFIFYDSPKNNWYVIEEPTLPMDLRNAADLGNGNFAIAGGMMAGQKVTSKVLLLHFEK